MNLGTPLGVGFLPKRESVRPKDWNGSPVVDEICSVSECIVPGPRDRIQKWLHNEFGLYPSVASALQVIESGSNYEIYGYRIYPWRFDEGNVTPWSPPVALQLDLTDFGLLGYDTVYASSGAQPECSPLSCN